MPLRHLPADLATVTVGAVAVAPAVGASGDWTAIATAVILAAVRLAPLLWPRAAEVLSLDDDRLCVSLSGGRVCLELAGREPEQVARYVGGRRLARQVRRWQAGQVRL